MSSLNARSILLLLVSALFLTIGCSDPKSAGLFNPETGKHPSNWLPGGHAFVSEQTHSSATASTDSDCTACHGTDLSGGISGVSCTHCHLGGTASIHPLSWDPIYSTHGPSVNSGATPTASCSNQYCHGASLLGVSGSGPSCTSCHLGGPVSIHPAGWDPIYLAHGPSVSSGLTTTASCANQYCHGSSLQGVAGSGPACTSCHSYPYNPSSVTCGACHRIPPSGANFPNSAGAHAKHATSNVISCNICHNGAAAYVGDHSDSVVNFSFPSTYNPKTGGVPSYTSANHTCSNVSCHGAKSTPDWLTGTIDVSAQCGSCHSYGTAQYSDFHGTRHNLHVNNRSIACQECHDTAKLAQVHFNDLNTSSVTEAWRTLLDSLNYTGTGQGAGNCTVDCHNKNHDQLNWVY